MGKQKNKKKPLLRILWNNREILITLASLIATAVMWFKKMMTLKKKVVMKRSK